MPQQQVSLTPPPVVAVVVHFRSDPFISFPTSRASICVHTWPPSHCQIIVVMRDGLGEGQLAEMCQVEVAGIKEVIISVGYRVRGQATIWGQSSGYLSQRVHQSWAIRPSSIRSLFP